MSTFVVFGFGPISAGLFLYEAQASGNFDRLVVAYRRQEIIEAVRANGGSLSVNIAHADRVEAVTIAGVELYNVALEPDRNAIISAVAAANEIATALGSIKDYVSDGAESVHRLLAQGLAQSTTPTLIYAAENHNHAAEHLEQAVLSELTPATQIKVKQDSQYLNTVIGKMSAKVTAADVKVQGLTAMTPALEQAFLVEAFNRIYISQISLENVQRGITQFVEKENLLPFEEAKLYGHNAVHALAAYLAQLGGLSYIRELETVKGMSDFLQAAFLEESGAALIKKYAGVDPLFTLAGFSDYVTDLMVRTMNPYLNDSAERVGRDVTRKLGWQDRLIGTMRLALSQGIVPRRFALGAAAALLVNDLTPEALPKLLEATGEPEEKALVLELIETAFATLRSSSTLEDLLRPLGANNPPGTT